MKYFNKKFQEQNALLAGKPSEIKDDGKCVLFNQRIKVVQRVSLCWAGGWARLAPEQSWAGWGQGSG